MTPIHIISRDLSRAEYIKKLSRDGYAKWRRNEEAAKARREEMKRCR